MFIDFDHFSPVDHSWQSVAIATRNGLFSIFELQNFTNTHLGKVIKFQFNCFNCLGAEFRKIKGASPPPAPFPSPIRVKDVQAGRSYTQNLFKDQYIIIQAILDRKSMRKFAVTDEKYSMSIRLLTVKDNSHEDMRTSHLQLLGKGFQHGEEDSK